MNDYYPANDFPWQFYFNGVTLPKWGCCWAMAGLEKLLHESWEDVGQGSMHSIHCRIDHLGVVESADPDIFRCVIQEVLCILLEKEESVMDELKESRETPPNHKEVYDGLLEAAFQMRELTVRDRLAFWATGDDTDRLRLVDAIRRASLAPQDPEYEPAPHIRLRRWNIEHLWQWQAKTLHRIASSGGRSKQLRKRLLDIGKT